MPYLYGDRITEVESADLLARLRARVARAKADLGAPDPLDDERYIAGLVMEPGGQ